jgi:hypothetical protein
MQKENKTLINFSTGLRSCSEEGTDACRRVIWKLADFLTLLVQDL